ncbi:hypothetical protein HK105_206127 [Polyrhizophydium stewartii]|uniref:Testis-expressed sequence 9 protein n=1 Tax=Polyrhizophydium stewartii TaxID=2732419 RepID=A0ABR4N4A2_9FUNG
MFAGDSDCEHDRAADGAAQDAMDALISPELLERERAFRKKNQALQSQAASVLRQAESVVKEGKSVLERPLTAPSIDALQPSRPATKWSACDAQHPSWPTMGPEKMAAMPRILQANAGIQLAKRLLAQTFQNLCRLTEATNRFLKAKLHVLQQELDKIAGERDQKVQFESRSKQEATITELHEKFKRMEEELAKSNRGQQTAQNAADKLRATVDELRRKNELAEGELQRTKRELDEISRHSRQNEHDTSARDAKLNRALEEVEKQKTLLARKDTEAREKLDAAKRASDALFAENKRLQRQKSELMAAFKKQAQLIAVLKRQKARARQPPIGRLRLAQMHVEAVKLLQFTEDEFVRALNWDL